MTTRSTNNNPTDSWDTIRRIVLTGSIGVFVGAYVAAALA